MKAIFPVFLLILFLSALSSVKAQEEQAPDKWQEYLAHKNRIDITVLGNRGFLNVIYNRILFQNKFVSIVPNIGTGVIPGSHDKDTIAGSFNFTLGQNIEVGWKYNRLVVGAAYSVQRKYGQDKAASTLDTYTKGVLGELGYAISLDDVSIKLSYTPVLFGKELKEFTNFPYGLSIGILF